MADERTCYAGDLTSDAIGKRVRVTYGPETARTTITDVLIGVEHRKREKEITTTLFFQRTTFRPASLLGMNDDRGLTVGHTEHIEVFP